jgi:heme/copper-type cytochrome/quinol oxidase subunit 3
MAESLVADQPLAVQPADKRASGWYGLLFVIATEAALFAYLLFSYFFLASQAHGLWPPHGVPSMRIALPNTAILLASSVSAWWAQSSIERGQRTGLLRGLIVTLILGVVFSGLQIVEWRQQPFSAADDSYGSLYFTITGMHITHVVVGLVMLACLTVWAAQQRFTAQRHLHVMVGVWYWHFVDAVWLVVFSTFYLSPYLGGPS